MSLPLSQLGPLGLGLAWAVVCDLRRRRIPNVVAASVFVVGLGMRGYDGGFRAALSGLAAAVLLFILLYGPWRAGAIGGGDVKLAAADGAWVGLAGLPWFVLVDAGRRWRGGRILLPAGARACAGRGAAPT